MEQDLTVRPPNLPMLGKALTMYNPREPPLQFTDEATRFGEQKGRLLQPKTKQGCIRSQVFDAALHEKVEESLRLYTTNQGS